MEEEEEGDAAAGPGLLGLDRMRMLRRQLYMYSHPLRSRKVRDCLLLTWVLFCLALSSRIFFRISSRTVEIRREALAGTCGRRAGLLQVMFDAYAMNHTTFLKPTHLSGKLPPCHIEGGELGPTRTAPDRRIERSLRPSAAVHAKRYGPANLASKPLQREPVKRTGSKRKAQCYAAEGAGERLRYALHPRAPRQRPGLRARRRKDGGGGSGRRARDGGSELAGERSGEKEKKRRKPRTGRTPRSRTQTKKSQPN